MRDYRDAKAMAQTLRQALKERSVSLTHGESLELIAKILGFANWNVLSARIQAGPPAAAVTVQTAPALRRPVMPLRDLVLFPQMTTPIYAIRIKSIGAIERAIAADKEIFFVTQHRVADDDPGPEGLHQVGVIASPIQVQKLPDGATKLLVQGLRRARATRFVGDDICLVAELSPLQDEGAMAEEAASLTREVLQRFEAYANVSLSSPPQALVSLAHLRDPGSVADLLAQHLSLSVDQRQLILQTANVIHRLKAVLGFMNADRKAA